MRVALTNPVLAHGAGSIELSDVVFVDHPWFGLFLVLTGTMSNLKSVTILVSYRIFGRGEEPGLT